MRKSDQVRMSECLLSRENQDRASDHSHQGSPSRLLFCLESNRHRQEDFKAELAYFKRLNWRIQDRVVGMSRRKNDGSRKRPQSATLLNM